MIFSNGRIKGAEIRRNIEAYGYQQAMGALFELIEARKVVLGDFELKELALSLCGPKAPQVIRQMGARGLRESEQGGYEGELAAFGSQGGHMELREAGFPVTSTAFSNITGQLIFSEIRDAFENEAFFFTQEIPNIPSKIRLTETVPGIQRLGDQALIVGEGQDYPEVGFGEEWFTIARKDKRGAIVSLTEEMIFFDLTGGMPVERAREVGESLGLLKEKLLIRVFIGAVNNYIRNGVATNTYLTAGAYINDVQNVALNDWRDVDRLELLFDGILDPNTGEPISILDSDMVLIVNRFKKHTARQILGAAEIRTTTNPAAPTQQFERRGPKTLDNYRLIDSSRQLQAQMTLAAAQGGLGLTALQAREYHWLGALSKAFGWYEVWPLRTFQQAADSESGFQRDAVMRFKASMFGVAQAREPRLIVRGRNT